MAGDDIERDELIERYLARVGLDGGDLSLSTLCRAHVAAIPYENLDVRLGREIRLDVPSLIEKMVDRRRGGYCYEQNTLLAALLEALGHRVTRFIGRVRLGDPTSPRPATHMVLLVDDDQIVDVGFGSATPLGPIPLGGEASYGRWTWRMERATSPEGERVWRLSLFDLVLYTFSDVPQHAVDYVTPNHYSSTHPRSIFTQWTMVQRSEDDAQLSLVDGNLTTRLPDLSEEVVAIDRVDLGRVVRERMGLDVTDEELAAAFR